MVCNMFYLPLVLLLNAALTLAIFYWSDDLQALTLCSKTLVRDGIIDIPAYFKRRADTPSSPVAFFTRTIRIHSQSITSKCKAEPYITTEFNFYLTSSELNSSFKISSC